MQDTSILKNKVYLYLLTFYNGQSLPSYVTLSKETGLSRQTVSKKVKELIDNGIVIDKGSSIEVKNILDLDLERLRVILYQNSYGLDELFKLAEGSEECNITEASKSLGISRASYHLERNKEEDCIIYGIISEGTLKYVGSTELYSERIAQHIRKRPFLKQENFCILKRVSFKDKLAFERSLIKTLNPEWNIMAKEE